MRTGHAAIIVLALLAGAGCAGESRRDGLSPREFARVEGIALYRGTALPRNRYEVVDQVEGISCSRSRVSPSNPDYKVVTEHEAIYDLRLEAADLGADAVIGVECARDDDFFSCREALVCSGSAVRLDDGIGMQDLGGRWDQPVEALRTSPDIYQSLGGFTPDYLTERQRASLGKVGVGLPEHDPGYEIHAPPTGGAAAAEGAGQWFIQCLGQGGSLGLIVSPLCAAIGAGIGTLSAESEDVVIRANAAIATVLKDYYVHESLRERMVRAAAQTGAEPLVLADSTSAAAGDLNSIIEVGLEELLLPAWNVNGFGNQAVPLSLRARVRVYRYGDSTELYNRSYRFTSDRHLYSRWGASNAALLRHTLEIGFEDMAERIVEDLLLVYPLLPVFGGTGIEAPYGKRRYRITPLDPPAHTYDYNGRPWPARVTSFTPVLRWRPFPDATVSRADFQGKLASLSELRYDLRLYRLDASRRPRLVLERNRIAGNEYALEQPLAPDSGYVWSIRARFQLDQGDRVTRWSGDWLGRGLKGFYFRSGS